jgi:hypothetical protein
VYIQRNEGPVSLSPVDADVRNPYIETAREWVGTGGDTERARSAAIVRDRNGSIGVRKESQANIMDLLSSLDNGTRKKLNSFGLTDHNLGSTIIVFESSQTGESSDTLIQARQEIEVRWVSICRENQLLLF